MKAFEELLEESVAFHGHLCPGQVLGVRMALLGCSLVDVDNPTASKRLIVYVEIDRCATDAIQSVTGCKLGKRTLKYVDYGKMAATFLDTETGRAVRIVARDDSRERAWAYATVSRESTVGTATTSVEPPGGAHSTRRPWTAERWRRPMFHVNHLPMQNAAKR